MRTPALLAFVVSAAPLGCASAPGTSPTEAAVVADAAGGSSDGAMPDGGDPCVGRVPDPAAPASSASGSGTFETDGLSLEVSSVRSVTGGMAWNSKNDNDELFVYLSAVPDACGRERSGLVKNGEVRVEISTASNPGTKLEAKSYGATAVFRVNADQAPGPCGSRALPARPIAARGTLTLTRIGGGRFAGTFSGARPGADLGAPSVEVTFDASSCRPPMPLKPALCCVP